MPAIPAPPFLAHMAPTAVLPANYINITHRKICSTLRAIRTCPSECLLAPASSSASTHAAAAGVSRRDESRRWTGGHHERRRQRAAQGVKPGETIGPFRLIDITRDDLTLEWTGQMSKQLWKYPEPVIARGGTSYTTAQYRRPAACPRSSGTRNRKGSGRGNSIRIGALPAERQFTGWHGSRRHGEEIGSDAVRPRVFVGPGWQINDWIQIMKLFIAVGISAALLSVSPLLAASQDAKPAERTPRPTLRRSR